MKFAPSKYGLTFQYIGNDATIVVNPQGRAMTSWLQIPWGWTMKQKLTNRQIEIVKKVFPGADFNSFIARIEGDDLHLQEIEMVCLALNNEFLMNGIDENFEATSYGMQIEDVIDIINRPRLR